MLCDDSADILVEVRLQLREGAGLAVEYRGIAGRGDELDYHEYHDLRIAELVVRFPEHGVVYLGKVDIALGGLCCQRILEYAPAQIFRDEHEESLIFLEFGEYTVDNGYHLVLEGHGIKAFPETCDSACEYLARLVGYEPVADIVFVLEIEVEGTLADAGFPDDIGYRGLAEALCGEELERCFEQRILLLLFIFFDLSHIAQPFVAYPVQTGDKDSTTSIINQG